MNMTFPARWCTSALTTLLLIGTATRANNIQLANPTLTSVNTFEGHCNVRFDITWENSWRTSSDPFNWDGAWVFVKYRTSDGLWHHAKLGNDAQHVAPVSSIVSTGLLTSTSSFHPSTNYGVGAFVYRSADGSGTFTATGTELRWNYGPDGINYADITTFKVFAVEMVYVPQGSFYLGSGGDESCHFYQYPVTNSPYPIMSEASITVGTADGDLYYPYPSSYGGDAAGPIPAAFPKGYAAFYIMKHEIAQQQYVDFLNTLTRAQQNTRTETNLASGVTSVNNRYVMRNSTSVILRNGICCDASIDANAPITFYCDLNGNGTGNEATDGQWVACNCLSWADLAAWLDRSGLQPMTELEYEKAGRGSAAPVPNEYVWGGTSAMAATGVSNGGGANESTMPNYANTCHSGYFSGPVRTGTLATANSTRAQSGSGYTGALALSDNLKERPVTVGNATGRAFEGTFGNGALDATGNADAATWPSVDATGAGFRGGDWNNDATHMRLSNRSLAARIYSTRYEDNGGRGVR